MSSTRGAKEIRRAIMVPAGATYVELFRTRRYDSSFFMAKYQLFESNTTGLACGDLKFQESMDGTSWTDISDSAKTSITGHGEVGVVFNASKDWIRLAGANGITGGTLGEVSLSGFNDMQDNVPQWASANPGLVKAQT